jgi:hypothetical protein
MRLLFHPHLHLMSNQWNLPLQSLVAETPAATDTVTAATATAPGDAALRSKKHREKKYRDRHDTINHPPAAVIVIVWIVMTKHPRPSCTDREKKAEKNY